MVVQIFEGRQSMVEALMLIFINPNNNYPIFGLEDNIPRVYYQIGPKDWIDQALFVDFFEKPYAFQSDLHGHTKIIWVDNCTNHNLIPKLEVVLQAKHSILRYLLCYLIHLCQLVDTFIVSKTKDVWTK